MSVTIERKQNRLANERSPYLLQHKNNPVDWFPWCEEAFNKAKREDKPIFLSIGYSTCHWCHVMMRESFMDDVVAKILNDNFVSIKVDREERPDIDNIYMTFCQMYTGSGGWPLTIFMTYDKKPFFAGTYFPKNDRYGMVGFINVLNSIKEAYRNEREKIEESSKNITELIKNVNKNNKGILDDNIVNKTYAKLIEDFDATYGGFGFAPKFPMPSNLLYMLRYYNITKDKNSLNMVEYTLKNMYKGGIFDHIGYGFCRYSTDNKWLVPHFEKMLYDNALLIIVYAETYAVTKNDFYKDVCCKIIEFVTRDMLSEEGGFYCGIDAESEGIEGKYYLLKYSDLKAVLPEDEIEICKKIFDITKEGNFEGYSIPNLIKIKLEDMNSPNLKDKIEKIRKKLFDYRKLRVHPNIDDKILTSWNGLMIVALSYAGRVFENNKYIQIAKKCADFILNNMINKKERLLTSYRLGKVSQYGYIDDYAFFIYGLIELYLSTFDIDYIDKAYKLNKKLLELFWDEKDGGFYMSGKDMESMIVNSKVIYDGAIPSGNSVAAFNMIRLSKIIGNQELEDKVQKMFETFGEDINKNPYMYTFFNIVLLYTKSGGKEIIISGKFENEVVKRMIKEINLRYLPFTVTVLNNGDEKIKEILPYLKDYDKVSNNVSVYICENNICKKPVTCLAEFVKILD